MDLCPTLLRSLPLSQSQELDRVATETVSRMFHKINMALYKGKATGTPQVDKECHEWSSYFPHLG